MSIFKCKMCGGTIEFEQGATVGVCDSCGTKQTLPRLDDDRRANLYDRANHFRRNNEFDKAAGIYEQILTEDTTDAEAYWSLVLCRYGIEYVEDPATHKRVPTVNRAQFTSIFDDDNYKSALRYADGYQRELYEKEAKTINDIQKGILAISQKEEPFDVFICYKETDPNGRRTPDSVLATDLYHGLTQEGFKVFFARITLEDKLGTAYEPYIFAALNSAKVMVVLGTKPEHFNAVWVKNEWSRYLALVKKSGGKKTLIPAYRDMDPYDLPEEFSHLQAQDMAKLGFMQDLIRGIKKIIGESGTQTPAKEPVVLGAVNANIAPLLKRAFLFLEDGEWDEADAYCEKVLDQEPENAEAYLGKLMAELRVRRQEELENCKEPFDSSNNYQKAVRFGDAAFAETVKNLNKARHYNSALRAMNAANTESAYKAAAGMFKSVSGFQDADALAEQCLEKAEICRKDAIYASARTEQANYSIVRCESAIRLYESISGWKDADEQITACQRKIEEIKAKEEAIKAKAEALRLERERQAEQRRIAAEKAAKKRKKIAAIVTPIVVACIAFLIVLTTVIIPSGKYNSALDLYNAGKYDEAITAFKALNGYKDSETQITKCETAIKDEKYNSAADLYNAGKYDEAITAFKALNGHKDSETQITKCETAIKDEKYNSAVDLYNAQKYEDAYKAFYSLNYKDSADKAAECLFVKQKAGLANVKAGSTIKFGFYEQDNNTSNGKEEIEWKVLAVEGNKALIISQYALDCQEYYRGYLSTDTTWEECTLRTWLNGTFYNAAFGAYHQKIIASSTVTADKNPEYNDISPGNNTTDKVFLLSITEVNKYFSSDSARQCRGTAYCYAQDAYKDRKNGNCLWWLRSPGKFSYYAAYVADDGYVSCYGNYNSNDDKAVRPALWINLGS